MLLQIEARTHAFLQRREKDLHWPLAGRMARSQDNEAEWAHSLLQNVESAIPGFGGLCGLYLPEFPELKKNN